MRLKIVFATAILAAAAATNAVADEQPDPLETCTTVATLAERIVDMRYSGVSMAQMMGAVGHDDMARAIVRDAYNLPNFSSSEYQNRAKREFVDAIMGDCLDAFD